jgi:hypothetical protein
MKPVMELHCGAVRVTAWPSEKASERQGYPVLGFRIERRFKNQKNDWHSSQTFFKRDLLDLAVACRVAYERLSVKEWEPDKSGADPDSAKA